MKKRKKTSKDAETRVQPGPIVSVLTMLLVLVISAATAAVISVMLDSLLSSLTVFIFTLIVLVIVIPSFALLVGVVGETVWFKTYVLVLKKIPALEVMIDAILKFKGRDGETYDRR